MAEENALQVKEEKQSVAIKDPAEQLRDFEEFARQHSLQTEQPAEVIPTTKCPVHHESGIRDSRGETPLIQAIREGDYTEAEEYIKSCTDIQVKVSVGIEPLMFASLYGASHIVSLLLEHGADPNEKSIATGNTALHFAAMKGEAEIVDLLLKGGADIDAIDNLGATARKMICNPMRHTSHHPICHQDGVELAGNQHNENDGLHHAEF